VIENHPCKMQLFQSFLIERKLLSNCWYPNRNLASD